MGGQLASVNLRSVNDFLFRHYRKSKKTDIWIGLRRCENKWCYSDGNIANFYWWSDREPNNAGSKENCVEMWDNSNWNDAPCGHRRPSVCEIPGTYSISAVAQLYVR